MDKFLKKWNGKAIEDDGAYMSKEAKSFVTAFRNMLKRELGEKYDIVQLKAGHYCLSGFIEYNGMCIYVSYDIPRSGAAIDADAGSVNGCLYRCAKGPKDFTGGHNNFCSIRRLPECIRGLFDRYKRFGFC